MLKVDLGGAGKGGEWLTINLDGNGIAHNAPDIVADITAGANQLSSHLQPQSIDEARCIAVLEHLPPWNLHETVAYWRTFLKPGAKLLVVVPDMRGIALDYLDGKFGAETMAGMLFVPADWQWRTPWEVHQWGFDEHSLAALFEATGWRNLRYVEVPEPWFRVDEHRVPCLALEAEA